MSDVDRYLADLVAAAGQVLGDALDGAYVAGSIALDAYLPGRSDVDVALTCTRPLALDEKRALVARLRHEALPCPGRGLELVVYQRAVAASGTPEPGFEVELNGGREMAFRETHDPADRPVADGLFWYGLDRSILHEHGRALTGPPAADTFADPSPSDLRGLVLAALRWWHALPGPAGDDAVLGACRSLVRVRHGTWLSKDGAAARLLADGTAPGVVAAAVAARRGRGSVDPDAARAFQQSVITEIAGTAQRG